MRNVETDCPTCGITYTGPNAQVLAEICEVTDRRVAAQEFHEQQRDPV
jgi:hypothetical protein